jgi:hypothetical protein
MAGWAQTSNTVSGQWQGTIKVPSPDAKSSVDVTVVVDLSKNQKGEWIGTFGMPDLGAIGLPLAKLVAGPSSVSFTVPDVPSTPSFDGKLSADGSLSGTFTTGTTKVPLSLKRTGAAKVALPAANSTISKAFEGAWQGSYDSGRSTRLHLVLKLSRRPDGTAAGTLTNIDGGNVETPVTGIDQTGNQLHFEIRSLGGKFRGSMNSAGTEIKGEWMQTGSVPLTFTRGASVTSVNSVLPKSLEGNWTGTLDAGKGMKLEFVLKFGRAADGTATGTLGNTEANSRELPLSVIIVKDDRVQFDVGQIAGTFHGTLEASGTAIAGTWEQENLIKAPLAFKRPVSAAK